MQSSTADHGKHGNPRYFHAIQKSLLQVEQALEIDARHADHYVAICHLWHAWVLPEAFQDWSAAAADNDEWDKDYCVDDARSIENCPAMSELACTIGLSHLRFHGSIHPQDGLERDKSKHDRTESYAC